MSSINQIPPRSKCFVYLRRSQDREDRQQLSIPKQEAQVRSVIKDNDFLPIQLPDEERSAKKPGRPIFNDMIERIEKGEARNIGLTSRKGKPISKQTLVEMLQRRTNIGVFQYSGKQEWHIGTYQPLISADLYDRIQVAMGWKKPTNHERPATTSGRYYTYKGLLSCKTCRFNVTAYTKAKKLASGIEAEYVFYVCTEKNRNIKCDEEQISDSALEQNIIALMQEYEISKAEGVECYRWLNRHYSDYVSKHDQHRPQWMKDKQKAQKALDILDEKLESGVMSDERYKDRAAIHL